MNGNGSIHIPNWSGEPISIVLEVPPAQPSFMEQINHEISIVLGFMLGMFVLQLAWKWWVAPVLQLLVEELDDASTLERAGRDSRMESRAMQILRMAAGVPEQKDAYVRVLQEKSKASIKRLLGFERQDLQFRQGSGRSVHGLEEKLGR
jgi:hypothetical protein